MRFGLVGFGRMGASLAHHALTKGHQVVAYDQNQEAVRAAAGVEAAGSVSQLVETLSRPRAVLLYLPHGAPTEDTCQLLVSALERGDLVADGGNSHWQDSVRRHELFAAAGISFLDVGTSGGVPGARRGAACFMVGGDRNGFEVLLPLLRDLAIDDEGVYFAGGPGAGHFVKLVHNAIEFGMVQAIAEGVELLQRADYRLDLGALFNHWMHGSVIRSWLIGLMGKALREHPDLERLSTYVEDTGEVKWILEWSQNRDIPTPVVSASQIALMMYRDRTSPAAKAVALLRNQFGEHPIHVADSKRPR
jgi:6-phosphogluconate dehydrogenase